MNNIKIITDSCADLSTELLEKYDIDYAKMSTVYQGKESPALLAWENMTSKEFYDILRGSERITTTQVPVQEFKRIFKEYLDKGYDIIYRLLFKAVRLDQYRSCCFQGTEKRLSGSNDLLH